MDWDSRWSVIKGWDRDSSRWWRRLDDNRNSGNIELKCVKKITLKGDILKIE